MNRRPYAESPRSGFIIRGGGGGGLWGLWGFDFAAILPTEGCFILPLVPKKTEGVLELRSHDQIVFGN